jgi:hypothetical protein
MLPARTCPLHLPAPCHPCRVMAEVMLDEIGRRPGAASKEEEDQHHAGSSGLHKVGGGPGRWSPAGIQTTRCSWLARPACLSSHGHTCVALHCCCFPCMAGLQGVTQDREGYALAAGLALGLITLGKGRAAVGLADLHLEDKLRWVLAGREKAAGKEGGHHQLKPFDLRGCLVGWIALPASPSPLDTLVVVSLLQVLHGCGGSERDGWHATGPGSGRGPGPVARRRRVWAWSHWWVAAVCSCGMTTVTLPGIMWTVP